VLIFVLRLSDESASRFLQSSTDYARSVSRLLPMLRDARDARSSA